jgi:hypothetical protein
MNAERFQALRAFSYFFAIVSWIIAFIGGALTLAALLMAILISAGVGEIRIGIEALRILGFGSFASFGVLLLFTAFLFGVCRANYEALQLMISLEENGRDTIQMLTAIERQTFRMAHALDALLELELKRGQAGKSR